MLLLIILALALYRIAKAFWIVYVRPPLVIKQYIGKNNWALITGATDGIGKQVAIQLAQLGSNIILLGRSEHKLAKTKEEISPLSNIQVHTVRIDLAHENAKQRLLRIREEIGHRNISILVNNAGVLNAPKTFDQLSIDEIDSMLAVNEAATVYLTKALLPGMLQAKHGIIINVGSMAATFTIPHMQVYGATKGFVERFTLALHNELASKSIHVEYVCPSFVATKLSKIRQGSLFIPTAAHFAACAVKTFGCSAFNIPVPMHRLLFELANLVPTTILEWILKQINIKK